MKQSILPFKKYPSFNLKNFPQNRSLVLIAALASCSQPNSIVSKGGAEEVRVKDQREITLVSARGESSVVVGKLGVGFCDSGSLSSLATILKTSLGEYQVKIVMRSKTELAFRVDGANFDAVLDFPIDETRAKAICSDVETSGPQVLVGNDIVGNLQRMIGKFIPSCPSAKPTDRGVWQCEETSADVAALRREIRKIHQSALVELKRHPYTLLRKMTVTNQLADALASSEPIDRLARICKITAYSLKEELPLALSSKAWEDAVCRSQGPKIEPAAYMLEESIKEIKSLTSLVDSGERGVISLKLPSGPSHSKDLWVSLEIKSPDSAFWGNTNDPTECWHPLYDSSSEVKLTAHILKLLTTAEDSPCRLNGTTAIEKNFAKQYIFSNLASETEFALVNGKEKSIKLPPGEYEYSIRERPSAKSNLPPDSSSPLSQGVLRWSSANSSHTLSKW